MYGNGVKIDIAEATTVGRPKQTLQVQPKAPPGCFGAAVIWLWAIQGTVKFQIGFTALLEVATMVSALLCNFVSHIDCHAMAD